MANEKRFSVLKKRLFSEKCRQIVNFIILTVFCRAEGITFAVNSKSLRIAEAAVLYIPNGAIWSDSECTANVKPSALILLS